MIKIIMKILVRVDFDKHRSPRFTNKHYLNEYGNCYAIAESQAHCNRG